MSSQSWQQWGGPLEQSLENEHPACLTLDLDELPKNAFPLPGSASSPNLTLAEQFNDLAWLASATSTPHGFEMSHPKKPFL